MSSSSSASVHPDRRPNREDELLIPMPARFPVELVRGEGVHVYTPDGRRFLDLYGGHAVAVTGHCHPRIVKALNEQTSKLIFYSSLVRTGVRSDAAEALLEMAPPGISRLFMVNSGAEANETALKMARRHTGRTDIVAMEGSFHGRTLAALSVTGAGKHRASFDPMVPGSRFVQHGDLDALATVLDREVAAVILEPVQSMAGCVAPPEGYLPKLVELAHKNGSVVIFDEIQTAPGRVGAWTAAELYDTSPDLMTLAKGIASGVPMSAVLVGDEIAEGLKTGEHGSTFGGGPLACAACCATMQVLKEEGLVENARQVGAYLREKLMVPGVAAITGAGLLSGIKLNTTARPVRDRMIEEGVLAGLSADPKVIRLLPPLTLREEHVDQAADVLERVLAETEG